LARDFKLPVLELRWIDDAYKAYKTTRDFPVGSADLIKLYKTKVFKGCVSILFSLGFKTFIRLI
jgi:hypothetical protein